MPRTSLLLAVIAAIAARSAAAQHLSLTPQIGFYIPTEKLAQLATGGSVSELEAGPSFGGRLGVWFGSRVGIEAGGSYVPTTFRLADDTQTLVSQDAKLFIGSGQLVVFLLPRTGLLTLYVSGGVGVVRRGGTAFATERATDVAGTVGAGAGIRLGGIALSASADFLGYSAEATGPGAGTIASVRQRDVHLKLGFGIPVGGGSGGGRTVGADLRSGR